MSDRTRSVPSDNATSATPNAEPAMETAAAPAAPPADPTPSPEVAAAAPVIDAEAVKRAAEAAAAEEQAQLKAAEAFRQAGLKAYAKGEAGYAAGLLESGHQFGLYYIACLTLGRDRKAITTAIRDGLTPISTDISDPSRLVLVWNAYALLGMSKAKCPATVYGTYRDQWCRLVERVNKDTPQESYVLLPGLEAECQATFDKAVTNTLSRDALKGLVSELVVSYAKLEAEREKAKAEQVKAKAAAEKLALEEQAAKVRAAREAHEKATADAKANASEATAAAVAESAARLQAEQKAVLEAQARAEQAEREKQAAEKRAKLEAERLERESRKAEQKAEKAKAAEQPATSAPAQQPPGGAQTRGEAVTGNLLRSSKAGAAKDVGDMAAEFLLECEQPDDALEAMLTALVKSGDLSGKAKRACEAALLILSRKDAPKPAVSPVEVARMKQPANPAPAEQVNGQVEPAAA
jgi:hypothetical protein